MVYLTLLASSLSLSARSQTPASDSVNILNDPMLPLYITGAAVLILLVLVLFLTLYVMRILKTLTKEALDGNVVRDGITSKQQKNWWQTFLQRMNAAVPVEQEGEIEMDHSYDGIRELDNHLPPWWTWLFYGTVAWGVVYLFVFHVSASLPLSQEEYRREVALAEEEIRKHKASQPPSDVDENSLTYTADSGAIEKGKTIFTNNNCGGCHRNDGGGNSIGPNLADEYWLHGGEAKKIFLTIKNGVVEKGMPAWGKSMSAQDVRDVTFFIMSLQGTNPPDAKAPQGEIFKQVSSGRQNIPTQTGL